MELAQVIALGMGAAWASGINLYAALLMLGLLGSTGNLVLPPELQILQDPLVIAAAGFMYCVEFFADKVPGVDTGWDGLHTFIRIPAGAVLAATAVGDVGMAAQVAAAIIGGSVAAVTHLTKTGSRVLINTSPEPVSNWTVSIAEDLAVFGGLWAALNYPVAFLLALAVFLAIAVWLLPRLWRGVRSVAATLRRWLAGGGPSPGRAPAGEGEADRLSFPLNPDPPADPRAR